MIRPDNLINRPSFEQIKKISPVVLSTLGFTILAGLGVLLAPPHPYVEAVGATPFPVPVPAPKYQLFLPLVSKAGPHYKVYRYADPTVSLENIKSVGIYFVPQGEAESPTWRQDMEEVLTQVNDFYSREFEGNSSLRLVIAPKIPARKKFKDYQSLDEIKSEIIARVLTATGDLYDQKVAQKLTPNEYESFSVYMPISSWQDAHIKELPYNDIWHGWTFDPAFWLDKESRTVYQDGPVNSAHEEGHTFNIPHPWDDPVINTGNNPNFGNEERIVMGWSFDKYRKGYTLKDGYLMAQQKTRMGITKIQGLSR